MTVRASSGRRGALSAHFAAGELACRHCGACVITDELVRVLERIRGHARRPLPVRSGYRCPIHNIAVGGAADSQHMYGTAADIPPGFVNESQARHCGAVGVGISKSGDVVHVDVRPGPPARWTYDT